MLLYFSSDLGTVPGNHRRQSSPLRSCWTLSVNETSCTVGSIWIFPFVVAKGKERRTCKVRQDISPQGRLFPLCC
ncbi:hypothetical protein P8452_17521 [Trifolium repens]|nr:hypothetical protein P8452_17521 [Trifolium repens]